MADYDGNREKLKPAKISANLQAAIDRIEEALVDWVTKGGGVDWAKTLCEKCHFIFMHTN